MLAGKPRPLSDIPDAYGLGSRGSCSPSQGPPQGMMIPRMQPRGAQRSCTGPEQARVLSGGAHILRCPLTLGPRLTALGVVVQRWMQRPTGTLLRDVWRMLLHG